MRLIALVLLGCCVLGCSKNPKAVSFRENIQPILNERCVKCHSTEVAGGKINLTSYDALMESRTVRGKKPLVIPEKVGESWLYILSATTQPHFRMPPDTTALPPLPKEELGLIARWISQGAKNN